MVPNFVWLLSMLGCNQKNVIWFGLSARSAVVFRQRLAGQDHGSIQSLALLSVCPHAATELTYCTFSGRI